METEISPGYRPGDWKRWPTEDKRALLLRLRLLRQAGRVEFRRGALRARGDFLSFINFTFSGYVADPAHGLIAATLEGVLRGKIKRLMILAPPQHGKLISHDTPVLTLSGWKTHGELVPGDRVFGRDGSPVPVQATGPEGVADRVVEFTDGARIKCHRAHEWPVFARAGRRPRPEVWETGAMEEFGVWAGTKGQRGGRSRFCVDANTRVDFPATAGAAVSPYEFGMRLGKGVATGIPSGYSCSSAEQRLALLAGIVDTSGYVFHRNGRVTILCDDPGLVEGISRLIASLGWRVARSWEFRVPPSDGAAKRSVCQITFNPTEELPLARKQNLKIDPVRRRRSIRRIRQTRAVPGRCIQVEGGVYLVGETLIPTCNSELVSVRFPPFWFAHRPNDPVILCSYAASLATSKSWEARSVVEGPEYHSLFPAIDTDRSSRAKDEWRIGGHRGGLVAAGVGGPITGHGALLGIIDDPFKNYEEAFSKTRRKLVWEWWRSVFRPRIWEGGAIVLVTTRWHEDDLAGRLLQSQPGRWQVLRLPAVAETQEERDKASSRLGLPLGRPDPLGREPGEALCPRRYSQAALAEIKTDVGSYVWSSQYRGSPKPPEGNRIKRVWFDIVDRVPDVEGVLRCRYWDKAGTEGGGAFSCGVKMAAVPQGSGAYGDVDRWTYYVEDVRRGQWSAGVRERRIVQAAKSDATLDWRDEEEFEIVHPGPPIWVEQEPGSGGKESAENTMARLDGFDAHLDRVTGAKETRWEPFIAAAEAKRIKLVRGPWTWDWLDEVCAIPFSTFRDQMDGSSGALAKLVAKTRRKSRKAYHGLA